MELVELWMKVKFSDKGYFSDAERKYCSLMPTLPRNMLNICAFLVILKLPSKVMYILLY